MLPDTLVHPGQLWRVFMVQADAEAKVNPVYVYPCGDGLRVMIKTAYHHLEGPFKIPFLPKGNAPVIMEQLAEWVAEFGAGRERYGC